MEGTIRFFNHEKFYGIVENEASSWFFHGTAVLGGGSVAKGDTATFSLADDPKRPSELMAVDVQKIGSATPPDPARLFVANVPYTLTEAELLNLFAAHGSVEKLDLIRDSETGDSRGFAFCQMADARSALNAIARLHGAELGGRRISVRLAEARPRARQAVEQRS